MRVLIIGGTGCIGPFAVRSLVARGHQVTLFNRGKTRTDYLPEVPRIQGDRANLAQFKSTFADLKPDVVLDMFAYSQIQGEEILNVFAGISSRLVVISSCDVYRAFDRFSGKDPGPPDPGPLTEQSPLRDRLYNYRESTTLPTDPGYLDDKILMERAVRSEPDRLPATVLRLPMVYGPGDDMHRVEGYLRRMTDRRPFILLPETISNWLWLRAYVGDIGEAIALCVENPKAANQTYHVGETSVTEREWVARIGEAAGWSGEIVAVPDAQMPVPRETSKFPLQQLSLDSSKIRTELGYKEAFDPGEAMSETVAWELKNPRAGAEPIDYAGEDAAFSTVSPHNIP